MQIYSSERRQAFRMISRVESFASFRATGKPFFNRLIVLCPPRTLTRFCLKTPLSKAGPKGERLLNRSFFPGWPWDLFLPGTTWEGENIPKEARLRLTGAGPAPWTPMPLGQQGPVPLSLTLLLQHLISFPDY